VRGKKARSGGDESQRGSFQILTKSAKGRTLRKKGQPQIGAKKDKVLVSERPRSLKTYTVGRIKRKGGLGARIEQGESDKKRESE